MSEQPETESLSFEDRMAAKLDPTINQPDETEEQQAEAVASQDADEQGEGTEPEFAEVDFEGEKYQVPPKLKDALMRQADYTRKTQEVAEKRQAFEIAQAQVKLAHQQFSFRESVKSEVDQIAMIDAYLKQPVDWSNLSTDDMLRKRAEIDNLKDRRAEMADSLKAKEAEFMEKLKGEHSKLLQSVNDHLAKSIKGWSPDTAKDVSEWAKAQGFTQEELNSIIDPRHATVLYKARQYDRLVAEKEAAANKVTKAPAIGKPGSSRPMPGDVKAKLNYAKALERAKSPQQREAVAKARIAEIFR